MRFPLAIKYDTVSFADGLGAQAIRILGIFSLACKYRLHYIHQDIFIEHPDELLGPTLSRQNFSDTMDKVHQLLRLPSSSFKTKKPIREINIRVISRRLLLKLIVKSLYSRYFIVINLQLPQGITDRTPDILEYGASLVRKNLAEMVSGRSKPECVLHLRSGNRTVKTARFNALPQLTPSYYALTLREFTNDKSKITIHTDFFPEDFRENIGTLRLGIFKDFLENFEKNDNVLILHYAPITEVILDMATANILIMGNSALSYFAGLLNTSTVIWPPIHGHAKMTRWKTGPILTDSEISFVDNTDHSSQPSPDHTVYKHRLND